MRRYRSWTIAACGTLLLLAGEVRGDAPQETDFTVAAMRVEPKPWNKAHNFSLLERYAREAVQKDASLVVTCEGFLDGYIVNPKSAKDVTRERVFQTAEPIDGPWLQRIAKLARELQIHLAVGFAELRDGSVYNTYALFSPQGKAVLRYSKTHCLDEPYTTPGNEFPVAKTELGTVGALICYDRRFPEVPRIMALKGAQFLLIPAYGRDSERNEALLRTRAWENSVWVIYVRQDQSLVINPSGKIKARNQTDSDELVFGRIELSGEKGTGEIFERRSPEIYHELLKLHTPIRP